MKVESAIPMTWYGDAVKAGLLPKVNQPIRVAVGPPDGLTSNSWKIWATSSGVYISCRDNFQDAKVSLHTGGRWRMGFTQEAVSKLGDFWSPNQNRAWEVWDEPPASLPDTVVAFRLIFPTPELAVRPDQRSGRLWKNVIFVEPGPPGKLVVFSLFVTLGTPALTHESEPTLLLGTFDIGLGRHAQMVVHGEPDGGFGDIVKNSVEAALAQVRSRAIAVPKEAFGYFLGRQDDGCRYLFGARVGAAA